MYTLEQRTRAVELYIKHGLEATTTIGELGYPSRVQLAAWHREWLETGGSLHERSRASEAYSAEQRRAAVDHHLEHGRRNAYTRRELGYPESHRKLADWIEGLAPGERGTTEPRAFTLEQRQRAVTALVGRAGRAREVADEAGSSRCALCKRKRELLGEGPDMAGAKRDAPAQGAGDGDGRAVRATQADTDALEARETACAVLDASDGTCGRRRTHDEPEARGRVVGGRGMRRMMAEGRPEARGRAKPKGGHGSCEGEVSERPGSKVRRGFEAGPPDFPWLTDVTQLSMPAGRLCLSPAPGCFGGAVVSRTTSTSPSAGMASSMLGAALDATAGRGRRRLVAHSDRGRRCRRPEWMGVCEGAGMARSTPREGRSPDNSRTEGFFGTVKTEMFRGRDWAGVTLDELGKRIDAYIERHNTTRIKRSLGSMGPLQYRRSLGLAA